MKIAKDRVRKYRANTDSLSVFLMVKRQKKSQDKTIGLQTEKDNAISAILAEYELDARLKMLALEAWRTLYYRFASQKQKVVYNE